MKQHYSLAVLDDRAVLVDGIMTVANHTYPGIALRTRATPIAGGGGTNDVAILGCGVLEDCPGSIDFQLLRQSGTRFVALIGRVQATEIERLTSVGVDVFVSISEGLTELLKGVQSAYEGAPYLSPAAAIIRAQHLGAPPRMSPREREIAVLYLSENDWSVDDVAGILHISSQTVRSHLARLRSHFSSAGYRVHNRLELRNTLLQLGLVEHRELGKSDQLIAS